MRQRTASSAWISLLALACASASCGNAEVAPSMGTGGGAGSVAPPSAGSAGQGSAGTPTAQAGASGSGGSAEISGGAAGLGEGAGAAGSGGGDVGPDTGPPDVAEDGSVPAHPDAGTESGAPHDAATPREAGSVDPSKLPAITLYLAGDSTVMTYAAGSAQEGWGQELGAFFISKVTIKNTAIGGRSIHTFMYSDTASRVESGTWSNLKSSMKPGDYLMIDFGINDSGGVAGRGVTTANFKVHLNTMVDAAQAKQATAMPVTPSALQYWMSGVETNDRLAPYVAVMKQVGLDRKLVVDDLNQRSLDMLNKIGQTAAQQIYIGGDKAHFTKYGATEMAKLVVDELRVKGSPLADYLK